MTPYDAAIRAKFLNYMEQIKKYNLLDLWEDMVGDLEGLSDIQLCNLAEALLNKNLMLKRY